MIGVAVTGERKWHASWWEWHGLIVTRTWSSASPPAASGATSASAELYLPTTRERRQDVSVLFARSRRLHRLRRALVTRPRSRQVLDAYWGIAAPLITRQFGGEVEKFIGDGMMATFNSRGDQPDHALRAAAPRSRCSDGLATLAQRAPGLAAHARRREQRRGRRPRDRRRRPCRLSTVGDTVNTGARLEGLAPAAAC